LKKLLVLLTISILIFSCGVKEKKENAEKLSKPLVFRDSLLYADSTTNIPFTGRYKSKALGNFIEFDVKDGKKDGDFFIYFPNKKIQISGKFKNDKNVGEWKYYRSDGSLESAGIFENGLPNGKWAFYFENGKLSEEGTILKGNKEGEWKIYNDSGKVSVLLKFKKDVVVDSVNYEKKKETKSSK
jgi:hypothetical protein